MPLKETSHFDLLSANYETASCYFIARSRKALTQLKFDVRGPADIRGIICKTPRTSRGDSRKPSLQIREFLSLLWQRRTSVREAKSDRHRSRGLHYSKGVGVLHSAALLDSRKLTGEKQPSVEGSPISSSFLRQVHGDPLPPCAEHAVFSYRNSVRSPSSNHISCSTNWEYARVLSWADWRILRSHISHVNRAILAILS